MSYYQPRGTLARVIYEKYHNDRYLEEFDTKMWYTLNQSLPVKYQERFVPLKKPDETTIMWMENSKTQASKVWLHLWHAVARSLLQFFMTQTDINGILKRGSMYILSEHQFENLLQAGGFNSAAHPILNVLDIGAGDGEITLRLLRALKGGHIHAYATETSWTMRKRLEKLHFNVIERIPSTQNMQIIACLNVLDRCIDPFDLLKSIYNALAPDGRVIVALVLPYMHYVEFNTSHQPLRPLMGHWPHKAKQFSFEAEATIFFELLESQGFEIESWTKAPYLCEGDLRQSYYWLVDLVVVLSKSKSINSQEMTNR